MANFERLRQHPIGFWYIFWGELAERASFYGTRTLLALYLVDLLPIPNSTIKRLIQAICVLIALLFILDRTGIYRTGVMH